MATKELDLEQKARLDAVFARLSASLQSADPSPRALIGPATHAFERAGLGVMAEAMASPLKTIEMQVQALNIALDGLLAAKAVRARLPQPSQWHSEGVALLRAAWEQSAVALRQIQANLTDLPPAEAQRLAYFTEQMIEFLNPANFITSNPAALAQLVASGGESWLRGLENLAEDMEAGRGEPLPRLAAGFVIGESLALTEGRVLVRHPLYELIQYRPRVAQSFRRPLVIFPPWINKFYVLDLRPENSFVRWALDQGFEVFMVSWVNPSAVLREKGLEAYVQEGILRAIEEVRALCNVRQVNVLGYCVAGTGLAAALALLQARGQNPVASATFLTTMTDFVDQGAFKPYLGSDFRDGITAEAERRGVMPARYLARTFAYLRPKALIYGPARQRYLLGTAPPAFDLLYWNSDGTNLTAAMSKDLLDRLWTQNALAKARLELGGKRLDLSKIDVPIFALACEADHIAPWQACYDGFSQMGAEKTFVLAGSGHVAGVVHPPEGAKYGYRIAKVTRGGSAQEWRSAAALQAGSWWQAWADWLKPRAGSKGPARVPEEGLGPAPGLYVQASAWDVL